jgi:hypothetical protein
MLVQIPQHLLLVNCRRHCLRPIAVQIPQRLLLVDGRWQVPGVPGVCSRLMTSRGARRRACWISGLRVLRNCGSRK